MDTSDRSRLEKLLGMLGSSFDGERANAARMIAAMAEKKGRTIVELIFGDAGPRASARATPEAKPKPRGQARSMLDRLAAVAADEEAFEFVLTEWELQFARDVAERYGADYELTEKQIVIVERILKKVDAARERAGSTA
jgi:hypothetical protein